jgi:hypothetical protein
MSRLRKHIVIMEYMHIENRIRINDVWKTTGNFQISSNVVWYNRMRYRRFHQFIQGKNMHLWPQLYILRSFTLQKIGNSLGFQYEYTLPSSPLRKQATNQS